MLINLTIIECRLQDSNDDNNNNNNNGNLQWHLHRVAIHTLISGSNWNLEMLVFEERGKLEYPEKNFSGQRREPTTNSTHIWRRAQELISSHIGGGQVLSPLHHPSAPGNAKKVEKSRKQCSS